MTRVSVESVQRPDAHERARGDEPCFLCGKATRGELFVHVAGYGAVLVSTDEQLTNGEDLGYFAVGPECKRRLPAGFVTVLAEQDNASA